MLGEDEELLWQLAECLEPEDGCLWVYDVADQHTMAFTNYGLECLQDLIADHKRSQPHPRP